MRQSGDRGGREQRVGEDLDRRAVGIRDADVGQGEMGGGVLAEEGAGAVCVRDVDEVRLVRLQGQVADGARVRPSAQRISGLVATR